MLFNKYKLSKYNALVQDGDVQLLYNHISGVLIEINDRLKEFQGISSPTFCFSKFKRKLRKHGFLVTEGEDELEKYKRTYLDYVANNKTKRFLIAVTDRCNSGCFYCYEKDNCKGPFTTDMSLEVQEQLVRFLDHCISSTPTDVLSISWYGGEPLLCSDTVYNLAIRIRDICKERSVEFWNNMVTNGTLLNQGVIEQLLFIGCRNVQITIDGIREIHDKRRPLLDCDVSSYDVIMKNLVAGYAQGLEIDLRSNIDSSNSETYARFLSEILQSGLTRRNEAGGVVRPVPAITRLPKGLAMKQEDFAMVTNKAVEVLRGKTEMYRFLTMLLPGCMKHLPFNYAVSPTGKLTKCTGGLFSDSPIGTIYNMELAEKDNAVAISPLEDTECSNCCVFPSCGGGCVERHEKYDCDNGDHYGGCQPIRWTIDKAIVGLYHFLLYRGELGSDKE